MTPSRRYAAVLLSTTKVDAPHIFFVKRKEKSFLSTLTFDGKAKKKRKN